MHALIYGTGRWAQLIASKLDIDKFFIGSNKDISNYSRRQKLPANLNNAIVFIASETKNHFSDFKNALKTNPSIIYVEKGFSTNLDYINAKKLAGEIPVYILNQYRYSKVFDTLKENVSHYKRCVYDWKVDSSISEWVYHIASIDNYIRNKNNLFLTDEPNTYNIDHISSFKIDKSNTRNLKILVVTFGKEIEISLGETNIISFKNTNGIEYFEFYDQEDCLGKMIQGIMNQDMRLERI